MLSILIVAVILLYSGFCCFLSKDSRILGSRNSDVQQRAPAASAAQLSSTDAEMARMTWTALDDLQLDRLLKDSS